MSDTPLSALHEVVWRYIHEWSQDAAGPWWEHDVAFQLGQRLFEPMGKLVTVANKEAVSFLRKWPAAPPIRRLNFDNYYDFEGRPKGKRPDIYFLSNDGSKTDWALELKIWSHLGGRARDDVQARKAVAGICQDLARWPREAPLLAVLTIITLKGNEERFADEVKKKIGKAPILSDLGSRGVLIALKSVDFDDGTPSARLVQCWASSALRQAIPGELVPTLQGRVEKI